MADDGRRTTTDDGRRTTDGSFVLRPSSFVNLAFPIVWLIPVAIVILWRFDGLYGQDPFAYYDYATGPLRESLLALKPLPPFFWPPGYPLLVALATFVVGPVPLAGQLVSLAAGALVPVFTAGLAAEVWGTRGGKPLPRGEVELSGPAEEMLRGPFASLRASAQHDKYWTVPLLAGLMAALNGQLWQSSIVVMADTTGLAAATLGVWALARYGRSPRRPAPLLLAAGALAWAVLTRWIYALVALPCAAYALLILARHGRRVALVHGAAASFAAGLILIPVLVPAIAGLLASTGDVAPFAGDLQVYTWHPLNALRREFVTADGYLRYRLPNGLYYALAPAHRFYFTPLLAPLILPGLWVAARRRSAALLWLILGWAAVVYAFHAGAPWQNFRFSLAYLPPLAVLAAVGADAVARSCGRLRWLLAIYLAVGLAAMTLGGLRLTQGFIQRKDADLATVRRVEAQVPAHARLLTFNLTLTFRHYSRLETLELFELSPEQISDLLADGRPTFLLIDVANVEGQWRGRSPEVNYRGLREGPGLEPLGTQQGYTLFRVRRMPP